MMTFEEALKAVSCTQDDPQIEDMCKSRQTEFHADIDNSELAEAMAHTVVAVCLTKHNGGEVSFEDALLSIYLNGLSMGVAVGIQMEKAE